MWFSDVNCQAPQPVKMKIDSFAFYRYKACRRKSSSFRDTNNGCFFWFKKSAFSSLFSKLKKKSKLSEVEIWALIRPLFCPWKVLRLFDLKFALQWYLGSANHHTKMGKMDKMGFFRSTHLSRTDLLSWKMGKNCSKNGRDGFRQDNFF